MLAEVQTALASLTAIKTIADGLVAMRDDQKVLEVKLELMRQIFEIRTALDALQEQLAQVKEEKRQVEQAYLAAQKLGDEFADRGLFEVVPGGYVMAGKAADGARQKPPYYCRACYTAGKEAVLSFQRAMDSRNPARLHCPMNSAHDIELPRGTNAEWLARD